MYYILLTVWVLVAVVQFFLLSLAGDSRKKSLVFGAISACVMIATCVYGVDIVNFYADLAEAAPADWHCIENPDSPQCNGGMLIAHLFLVALSGWNLVLAPLLIFFFSVKGLFRNKGVKKVTRRAA